ncbi:MAG: reverse transcriptase domain-containing protein [Cyanobacteria bacterium J06582_2]
MEGFSNLGPRVFLSILVHKVRLVALADSGADISVISMRALSSLGEVAINRDQRVEVRGHGRNAVSQTVGKVTLPVDIGGLVARSAAFQVVEDSDINHDVVLGADFMYRHYLAPSPAHGRLLYAPPDDEAEFVGSIQGVTTPLYLMENLKLQPRTLSFHTFLVPVSPERDVVFEPSRDLGAQSVAVCRSIETVATNRTVTLEFFCHAQHRVVLKKGTLLGNIHLAEIRKPAVEMDEIQTEPLNSDLTDVADLFDWSSTSLTENQLQQVKDVIRRRSGAVSLSDSDVGRVELVAHHIKFSNHEQQPIKVPPRRFSGARRVGIEEEVNRLFRDGVIEPSDSPWSAPVVPIVKSDGEIRLCVDYRALNKATAKDAFPLPNIEDALYNLHGVEFFSTMDLIRGYYQVPMADSSKPFTAFSTAAGHWQFKRMPFGLCNAPATFQRLMGTVLSGFSWEHVMAYLDDIIMIDATFEDHLASLDKIMACFAKYGLKIKPKKCQLFRKEVQFLGHIVSTEGLSPDPANARAILEYPVPRTVRQVRRFMGMVNFYRRFIPNCSVLARPLNQLLGSRTLQWTADCQTSFDQLRESLSTPPILSYPDFGSEELFQLYTDASNQGMGACLVQVQDGVHKVVAYLSTTYNAHELNYSVLDKELAAIRWAVKKLKPFLWGHRFVIHSDHKPLSYLQSRKNLDSRLARMLEELGEFDFEIRYVPGKCNVFADALSRATCQETVTLPEPSDTYLSRFTEAQVKNGGDMLFRCFSLFAYGNEDDHLSLRESLIWDILRRPASYNVDPTPSWRRRMRMIRCSGVMPVYECVQAFSNLRCAPVFVYEDRIGFIHYEPERLSSESPPCFIRSYDGVCFTLLTPTGPVDDLLECRRPALPPLEVLALHELEDEDPAVDNPPITVEFPELESLDLRTRAGAGEASDLSDRIGSPGELVAKETHGEALLDPVVSQRESGEQSGANGIADTMTDASWRQALDVGAVRSWQSGSGQLRGLMRLYRDLANDHAGIRRACSRKRELKKFIRHVGDIRLNEEGVLVCKVRQSRRGFALFPYLVPFAALGDLLKTAHERNGHIGREKLIRLVLPYVYHPNLRQVAGDVARSCGECLRRKPFSAKVTPPVLRINTQRPFELVSVDLMELPTTRGQFKYVINAVDHHTKWLASLPLRNKTSDSCAAAFGRILAGLPGIPESVLSDNGLEFCGRPFAELLKHYNINQKFTTPYSPQCNGSVERVNKTLIGILTGLCKTPSEWDRYLSEAVVIYNNTYHRSIERTPAESFVNVASKLPIRPRDDPYWKQGDPTFKPYPVGSLVGRKILGPRGVSKKLSPRYEGPFVVERVHSNSKSYVLYSEDDPDKKVRAHYNQLRKWTRAPKYLQKADIYKRPVVQPDLEPSLEIRQPVDNVCRVLPVPGLDPAVFDLRQAARLTAPGRVPIPVDPDRQRPDVRVAGVVPADSPGEAPVSCGRVLNPVSMADSSPRVNSMSELITGRFKVFPVPDLDLEVFGGHQRGPPALSLSAARVASRLSQLDDALLVDGVGRPTEEVSAVDEEVPPVRCLSGLEVTTDTGELGSNNVDSPLYSASLGLSDLPVSYFSTVSEFNYLGFSPVSGEEGEQYEWDNCGLASSTAIFDDSLSGSWDFSGFGEDYSNGDLDIHAVLSEMLNEQREPVDSTLGTGGVSDVSPGVLVASVSPQVGDPIEDLIESLSEDEDYLSSRCGSYQLDSSDSFLSLPSLPSADTDDSPVSGGEEELVEAPRRSVTFGGYLTRAARLRLFPGLAVEDALDSMGQ